MHVWFRRYVGQNLWRESRVKIFERARTADGVTLEKSFERRV